jgi:hypothetical protein
MWVFIIIVVIILVVLGPILWYMWIGIGFGNLLINTAVKSGNPELCRFVPSTYDGNTNPSGCYRKVAIHNADPDICTRGLGSEYCYQDVAYVLEQKALSEKNIDFCKRIVDGKQKESCYMKYAFATGDQTACDLQTQSAYKNYCLARITKSISYCSNIGDKERLYPYNTWNGSPLTSVYMVKAKNLCIFDVAVVQRNANFCRQISEPNRNEEIISECILYGERDVERFCKGMTNRFDSERNCNIFA